MKRLGDVLTLAADHLEQHRVKSPRRQAEELLADALGLSRMQLYLDHEKPLTEEELDRCRRAVARRVKGEPAAYIAGFVTFLGCRIEVNEAVLIPRPETEILAEQIAMERGTLLDLCTGSGCIGIALKKKFPHLRVILSDICPKALEVAKRNAALNGVEVEIRQGDLLEGIERVDGVVCNPPYISEKDYQDLDAEVRREPSKALIGGKDGLDFYRRLAADLPAHLNPSAKVWLEIGYDQGDRLKEIFNKPCWKNPHLASDWAGHDRFFSLEFE